MQENTIDDHRATLNRVDTDAATRERAIRAKRAEVAALEQELAQMAAVDVGPIDRELVRCSARLALWAPHMLLLGGVSPRRCIVPAPVWQSQRAAQGLALRMAYPTNTAC
jgi:hypothetical protein